MGLRGKGVLLFNDGLAISSGVPDAQLNRLYNACDITVLPSIGEGFGLTALESMSAGVPPVVSNYSGLVDFVGEKQGSLIPGYHNAPYTIEPLTNINRLNADCSAMLSSIERFVVNTPDEYEKRWGVHVVDCGKEYRNRLSGAARIRAEGMDWGLIYLQWESLFVSLLKRASDIQNNYWKFLREA
jgi:glycosyltransferase involved in cell wall biosynthesis